MNRIGVIGDVHAEHERLETAIGYLSTQDVDAIVCTGDLPDGRGDLERCCELLRDTGALVVAGNHDRWFLHDKVRHVDAAHLREDSSPSTVNFIADLPKTQRLETSQGSLILCHGVLEDDLAKIWPGSENSTCRMSAELDAVLEQDEPPRFMINGHMHFRTVIDFPQTQVINAGTLKGQFAGFCMLDVERQRIDSYNFIEGGQINFVRGFDLALCPERRIWRSTEEFDGRWEPVVLHRA